jgi:hypothetical protein
VILTVLLLYKFIDRIRNERVHKTTTKTVEDMDKLPEIVPVPSIYFATTGREKPPSYQSAPSHVGSYIYMPRDTQMGHL